MLCRSGIPVATAVLAVAVENRVPTRAEFTSLLVLTAGVMIAVWEGAKGSMRGICFASLGMLSNAVRGLLIEPACAHLQCQRATPARRRAVRHMRLRAACRSLNKIL